MTGTHLPKTGGEIIPCLDEATTTQRQLSTAVAKPTAPRVLRRLRLRAVMCPAVIAAVSCGA